jgi:hypothetical protein
VAIAISALAALAAAAASLAMASGQDRSDLVPPSIAVGRDGLATVTWTEVARPGIRVAQESIPGSWSLPVLLSDSGGPGSVALGPDGRAQVAFTAPGGLIVAEQKGGSGTPRFDQRVLDPRGRGRPAIAIGPRGEVAVAYETDSGELRVALRERSGAWRNRRAGLSGTEPQLVPSGGRGFVLAALRDGAVVLRGLGGASFTAESVRATGPIRSFGLTVAGGEVQVSYVDDREQVLMTARPGQLAPAGISALVAGIGNATASSGARKGQAVVLTRHPRYRVVSLALLQGGVRVGDIAVDQGQNGDVALTADGTGAQVAYWDYPDGRHLRVARVPLRRNRTLVNPELLGFTPALTPASIEDVSVPQPTLPADGKWAIWLAALALLLTDLAGVLLLLGRRSGIRLLPFAIVLAMVAGFAVRGSYLAELGVYGLPPNDLLTLDRSGVDAVVDALLIAAAATAVLCVVGRLLPVGLGSRLAGRLKAMSLPSPAVAIRVTAVFLAVSLLVAASLLSSNGIDELAKNRQTAFAGSGYKLALLYAGAGAWLVYFTVSGWPAERRERLLLVLLGAAALVALLTSGTRTAAILGFIVPVLILIHLRIRPIPLHTAVIVLVALFVLAIGMRQLTRGEPSTPFLREAAPTTEADSTVAEVLEPALGWTEAAGFDGFVLVRTEYMPQFGADPFLTPGAFLGIPVPRRIWPGKPSSAMDTFTERINPWEFRLSRVGQTTSLPGELTMNWRLVGVFAGFAVLAVLLCLFGELLAGAGGRFGWLLGAVLVPPCGLSIYADSFNTFWGALVLVVMMALAVAAGRVLTGTRFGSARARNVASS